MTARPNLTPAEALAFCRAGDNRAHEGWHYALDGQMCQPREEWAPAAWPEGSLGEEQWCCSGEPGDPVDASTVWVLV